MESTKALWTTAKGVVELRSALPSAPAVDEILVRTLFSGLSRGTERLVFHGDVPPGEYGRMRAPLMEGDFPFPVKYGYAAVGVVEAGPADWQGKTVFVLHPHQDRFVAPVGLAGIVPDSVPARRAVLTANMETALNALWDSGAGAGDRVVIVGAGIVGLLIARLAARLPGADVTVIDRDETRAGVCDALGFAFRPASAGPCAGADVVFHTSASEAGLALALGSAGMESRIIEVSWYGERLAQVPLGGAFHSQRLQLISSQVGQIAPKRRARWDYTRRRQAALALLADEALDCLFTETIAFAELPAAMPRLLAPGAPGLQTLVTYP